VSARMHRRSREIGPIEPDALSHSQPQALPWIAGRFYGSFITSGALGTISVTDGQLYLTPIYIPQSVTLTSIGVEVTTASGAGSLIRLGIYQDRGSIPHKRLIDAGTVVGDALGFNSAAISLNIRTGLHWLALVGDVVTSALAVRATSNTSFHIFGGGHAAGLSTVMLTGATMAGAAAAADGFISQGLPSFFPVIGIGNTRFTMETNAAMPHVRVSF